MSITKEGLNQEALWQHYLTSNPHWQENGAKLTADGLKKLFDQTWERGYRVGHKRLVRAYAISSGISLNCLVIVNRFMPQ